MKKNNDLFFREETRLTIITVTAIAVIVVSATVILGWILDIKEVLSIIPGAATMKFNTALLFLFSGLSMLTFLKRDSVSPLVTLSLGSLIIIIAVLTIFQYLLGVSFHIDNLFVYDVYSEVYPGRMSPATAACFILTGVGIVGNLPHLFYFRKVTQSFNAILILIPFVALIAYILGIPADSKAFFFNSMAINTCVLFLGISVSISLKSHSGFTTLLMNINTGSKVLRLLLPLIIIPPVILSYLLLLSYKYQFFTNDFGVVLYTVVLILFGILYLTIIGINVNQSDKKRRKLENQLLSTNKELIAFKYGLDESAIVAITNPKGVITYVNDKFCELSQYSRSELLGQNHRIINSGHHPRHFFKELWSTIGSGNVWAGEIKNKAKDGSYYWVLTSIVPFMNENGKPYQYLSIRQDITKRKVAEELLNYQYSKLEQQNKELEQFAYIASHDLQEPLRTVSSFTELFIEEYEEKIDGQSGKYLDYILEAANRMRLLISNLLDYSLIGKHKKLTHIDCNKILASVQRDLSTLIKETDTQLEFKNLPQFEGYETELRLLFQNLIVNSIKFRKKEINPRITIEAKKEKDYWKFSCKDNGIGIPKDSKEKVFIIFQRLHAKNEYTGSGIGLAHCQKIVELHGGKIWFDSKPNIGSTFYFTIPNTLD